MITKEQLAQSILDFGTQISKKLEESNERFDKKLEESREDFDKKLEISSQRLDNKIEKYFSKLEKSGEKIDKRLDKIAKLVGNISNNQGDVAEEFFYNSMKSNPSLAGTKYDFIDKNVTRSKNNIQDEYDILLVNGKDIAIIEIKYKAHTNDIYKLVSKKYENFKKLYPEYKDYNHHLVLASFNINEDVIKEALDNDVIILQRKGDIIETIQSA